MTDENVATHQKNQQGLKLKLTERTINAIGTIVTGDEKLSPYRTGPQLVGLFNDYGANDVYGKGFPSRWQYAEEKLRSLNGTISIGAVLCHVLDPREFMDYEHNEQEAADYVNARLKYDGFEVVIADIPHVFLQKDLFFVNGE